MKLEDFTTVTWKRFRLDLAARLHELREMNDSTKYDPYQTATIRGKIAEVKRILALGESSATEGEDADE